jgi:CAP-Gly domain-containing linker protein 3/4
VLRLWEPMIQEHIGAVAYEMLKRGASVNDKDGLTDMTLLHFAAKSGARGLGDQGKVRGMVQLRRFPAVP